MAAPRPVGKPRYPTYQGFFLAQGAAQASGEEAFWMEMLLVISQHEGEEAPQALHLQHWAMSVRQ